MRRLLSGLLVAAVTTGVLVAVTTSSSSAAQAPGSFTGYAFDTCDAPSQAQMDAWWVASPFRAVGIYVSGSERACERQANLTPGWVRTQHQRGWSFIPIHVGKQAPCRGGDSKARMSRNPSTARAQGIEEAVEAMAAARRLGLSDRSYLYLDVEQYPIADRGCNEAVLAFMEGWTDRIEQRGYRSGVYSSASAAIRALDVVRADPDRRGYNLPGHLWFAWSNGRADVDGGQYLGDAGWADHQRLHQYQLDTSASYNGVRITIDRNFVDVGDGSRATRPTGLCNAQKVPSFRTRTVGARGFDVKVAECLLSRQGFRPGRVDERFTAGTRRAVVRMQRARGMKETGSLTRRGWTSLIAHGGSPVLKHGSTGRSTWRVQTALRAAGHGGVSDGVWARRTTDAMRSYRRAVGLPTWATAEPRVWVALRAGRR